MLMNEKSICQCWCGSNGCRKPLPLRESRLKRSWSRPAALFKRAMEALQFSVALRIVGRGQHMAGLPKADKLLEVARHELAAAIGDDPRPGLGVSLPSPLQDDFRVGFLHGGADIPGDYAT